MDEIEELKAKLIKAKKEADEAYRQLRETKAQLVQSSKMAAIGQLASGVAHQLNNPLVGVLNLAQLLLREVGEDSPHYKSIEVIVSAGKDCKDIVNSLLEFARVSDVEFRAVDVNTILERTLTLTENQMLLSKVNIVKELGSELPSINGDGQRLGQVFLNIIINALHAMSDGGNLTIRSCEDKISEQDLTHVHKQQPRRRDDPEGSDFSHLRRSPETIRPFLKLGSPVVVVEISDTGMGIPSENIENLFDPFFTTKKKGVGLGLSIAYGIVEKHSGFIKAESKVGVGSKFTIKIPAIKK